MMCSRLQASPATSCGMIVFFPTYACRTRGGWTARIAGMVARPLPERSRSRVLAVEAFLRPEAFRAAASYYGYTPDQPLPNRIAIGSALRYRDDGSVCATRKKDGPCLLVFARQDGLWKLSGFEGDLADLRGKSGSKR